MSMDHTFDLLLKFIKHLYTVWKYNGFLDAIKLMKHFRFFYTWRAQLASGKTAFQLDLPWINIESYYILKKLLSDRSSKPLKAFEYGSGGSTYFFLSNQVDLISVEHDGQWFELVKEKNNKFAHWKFILIPNDTNNIVNNNSLYSSSMTGYEGQTFFNYASTIDTFPEEYFDIILIDGRARNGCLHHAHSKVKKDGYLILDNGDRARYLPQEILPNDGFNLIYDLWSPSVCENAWTKTLIYQKKS